MTLDAIEQPFVMNEAHEPVVRYTGKGAPMAIVAQAWGVLQARNSTQSATIDTGGRDVSVEVALNYARGDADCRIYRAETAAGGVIFPQQPVVGLSRAKNISFYVRSVGGLADGRCIVNFWN